MITEPQAPRPTRMSDTEYFRRFGTRDAFDLVMAKVVKQDDGCWVYTARVDDRGYGVSNSRRIPGSRLVHRIVYERLVGPIPDGLVIDHLCRNHPCCNPEHLEPVTQAENIRRGEAPGIIAANRRAATHCESGLHEMTPENTYSWGNSPRRCRACRAAASRAYYWRKKAESS